MYTHGAHPLLPGLTSVYPFLYSPTPLFTYLEILLLLLMVPSTLVPGLPLLIRPPQGTLQIKLNIYIDNINNISCPA
jgi:hypothetical protein